MNEKTLADGFYNAVICDVNIIESRFGTVGAFELEFVCGLLADDNKTPLEPKTKVNCYQEVSDRFGMGSYADKTNKEIALDTLKRLGFNGGDDLSRLGELKNKHCRVNYQTKDKQGKPYPEPRAYISFGREYKKLTAADAMRLMRAMGAGSTPAAPAAQNPAAPAEEENPFD